MRRATSRAMRGLATLGLAAALMLGIGAGCGNEADEMGVGAQCNDNGDCQDGQTCLPFKGGYCGVGDCMSSSDCPDSSVCVTHTDGKNYCFRSCADKAECNANRDATNESNCSSNFTAADGSKDGKACIPPS